MTVLGEEDMLYLLFSLYFSSLFLCFPFNFLVLRFLSIHGYRCQSTFMDLILLNTVHHLRYAWRFPLICYYLNPLMKISHLFWWKKYLWATNFLLESGERTVNVFNFIFRVDYILQNNIFRDLCLLSIEKYFSQFFFWLQFVLFFVTLETNEET